MSAQFTFGQINYFKMYSGDENDRGNSIVQLDDSSYVIAGGSGSFDNGNSQAFLLKIDSLGNYLWSYDYGGLENESFEKVLHKENQGYYAVGYTNSVDSGGYDLLLSRVDENGVEQWNKSFGADGWERAIDAAFTSDSGLMIVGEVSTNSGDKDIWLLRTDSNGDTLWTQSLGMSGDDFPTSIESFQDSLYIISAQVYIEDSTAHKGYLYYLDENGSILSEDTLGSSNGDYIINDFFVRNDTLIATGTYFTDVDSVTNTCFFKFDVTQNSLDLIQEFQVVNSEKQSGRLITNIYSNPNSFYSIFGIQSYWTEPGGDDLFIGKFSNDFNWQGSGGALAVSDPDVGNEIIPTSDGGAMLVGYTTSGGTGGSSIFVVKIGPNDTYATIAGVTYVNDLVSTNEIEGNKKVSIYPNPTLNSISIEFQENGTYQYQLRDLQGKSLISGSMTGKQTIDLEAISSGMYIVEILEGSSIIYSSRLVVQ
jgi:hypothetical protein